MKLNLGSPARMWAAVGHAMRSAIVYRPHEQMAHGTWSTYWFRFQTVIDVYGPHGAIVGRCLQ